MKMIILMKMTTTDEIHENDKHCQRDMFQKLVISHYENDYLDENDRY